ncbi:tRNA-specific adenosine deaminase CYBJADRAFT_165319 [Cyberlindnera jadinii NRRL Y-1542]|uniref:A to I editase domain-containing protein n=1 Tax=Cyberlindnera jadinii (strain ATCC 18201 / CBS 1600 / BCRC 20928 / JCM 3617 / NBRC 0987 / NRRL Y-1542) TaxID=983966 RepID=A0A1E4S8Z5_CYBJN|nr:hypothetical protein CYBJADRAFT_165319 [Cyberlindnera jadinii NRRL Y-1542]ODV75943.1 hypothetical protein CYBJADRAFT_165319 [Cyberlindnera jadinii NRRL Y-1542]
MVDPDRVATSIIETFKHCKKGTPTIRKPSNVREWTVLSGIVIVDEDTDEYRPVVVTTGVKALPDKFLSKVHGKVLHDCHAEILALRAFNKFVVEQCHSDTTGFIQKCDSTDNGCFKFRLKEGLKIVLYISEPPCGDCSLELLSNDRDKCNDSDVKWDKVHILEGGVVRGRECFVLRGKVRTKPGRRDSPLTLSKSCSDKLIMKQYCGVLNALVSQFVDPSNAFIHSVVLPRDRCNDEALFRCFDGRLKHGARSSIHKFATLKTCKRHDWERFEEDQPPSNLSLVHIEGCPDEAIDNFVKNGFYSKKCLVRPRGESCLSRVSLFKRCKPFLALDERRCTTYIEVKRRNLEYYAKREVAKRDLGAWNSTSTDDFVLDLLTP